MEASKSTVVENIISYIPLVNPGSYPARAGNRLRPLVESGPAFRRICEAVHNAQLSVWLTVAFVLADFNMPDGHGTFLDVLDRAVARGVDVRVIFWRPNLESSRYGQVFAGTEADFQMLRARSSRFRARWDRAPKGFCQHQKSWLIDAGHRSETAFIGGINPTFNIVDLDNTGDGGRHDVYVEVTGPSATDVHHNFVQRWNEASERDLIDGRWPHDDQDTLSFPVRASESAGNSVVQIQRNVHAGRYHNSHATPGGTSYDIGAGEQSISNQYLNAIRAARSSIYIENQALPVPAFALEIERALKRGVHVVFLAPGEPEDYVRQWRQTAERREFFSRIEALGEYDNFTLVGLTAPISRGGRGQVYVHAKLMLVDDKWATIGSCNLHSNSLTGHTEINAAIWDHDWVRALRRELLREHLGEDTTDIDDRSALKLYRRIAHDNAQRFREGNFEWKGRAFEMAPSRYGT
ncbi:phospholipase D-like domain-containing protein [Paraburkholderia nodosa]|uniref:phospholipase D-like domain-containing protein n=1 Tax=Paraburkholderia nodosa TaxID=392320 RepID=UPI00114C984E|nr:phosphatidylserine/phosphatidylglycerophosphate/cardiolipin synthase family protein [Paraburkholderia nodosa]